jgi:IclR family transcriptional regulator, KDG regulon repressor
MMQLSVAGPVTVMTRMKRPKEVQIRERRSMPEPANRTIARTFEILDYLNERQRRVRLKQVVRDLGYPASSATVILKSLVVLGYASFDRASMTYTLTPRLAGMAQSFRDNLPPEDPRLAAARQRLSELTGGTVGIGIQSDIYAQYLSVVPNRHPMPYRIRPGMVRPITRCGLGLALLSRQSDRTIDRLRRRVNAKEKDRRLHIDETALAGQIACVREKGYAFSRGMFHEGIGFIGIAFPKPIDGRWLAFGVGGTISQLIEQEDLIVAELKTVAAEIQAASP